MFKNFFNRLFGKKEKEKDSPGEPRGLHAIVDGIFFDLYKKTPLGLPTRTRVIFGSIDRIKHPNGQHLSMIVSLRSSGIYPPVFQKMIDMMIGQLTSYAISKFLSTKPWESKHEQKSIK